MHGWNRALPMGNRDRALEKGKQTHEYNRCGAGLDLWTSLWGQAHFRQYITRVFTLIANKFYSFVV